MKHSKIFRILAIAITLSLLVMALPTAPALALDYDIDLDPDSGEIGDRFDIDGDDWPDSHYGEPPDLAEVDIYFSSEEAAEGDDIDEDVLNYELLKSDEEVDEYGEFSYRATVPDELTDGDEDEVVRGGIYYVYVTMADNDRIRAVAEFTVIVAEITIDPYEGPVGTEVEITGVDFADSEDIDRVDYDGDGVIIESGDDKTDSDGEFKTTILIPKSSVGEHTIKVTDDSDNEAEAVFTVEPAVTINPTSGTAGEQAIVNGTGFADGEDVTVTFDGDEVATGDTDTDGSFAINFEVPAVGPGTYDVQAEDDDNNSALTEFTIASDMSVSPVTSQTSPGHVGDTVTISGTGFTPDHTITITYASTPTRFTTTSEADVSFSYTFKVP